MSGLLRLCLLLIYPYPWGSPPALPGVSNGEFWTLILISTCGDYWKSFFIFFRVFTCFINLVSHADLNFGKYLDKTEIILISVLCITYLTGTLAPYVFMFCLSIPIATQCYPVCLFVGAFSLGPCSSVSCSEGKE